MFMKPMTPRISQKQTFVQIQTREKQPVILQVMDNGTRVVVKQVFATAQSCSVSNSNWEHF